MSEIKQDTGQKSRFFHTSLAFGAPIRGLALSEYWRTI